MRSLMAGLLLLSAACGGLTTATTAAPSTTSTTALPAATSSTKASIGCPEQGAFVATGEIDRVTQPSSDSRTLGLVSRQVFDGCERFGFDFDTAENAPATTPPSVTARFLDGERIIRISLNIDHTVITDQLIETRLVKRLFVVRALDETMFVDLHLNERANARISISNSPARLTIELNPGSGEINPPPVITGHTVLLRPQNQASVGADVEIAGYSRSPEANVLIVATLEGHVVLEESTTAADWLETWGEFQTTVTLPEGEIDLFVGEESLDDGGLEGVTLKLTVR